MRLIKPKTEILHIMGYEQEIGSYEPLRLIEIAGRTCYKSEDNITNNSCIQFAKNRIQSENPHESVIEHSAMTVRFICDRGVSHELVRHRLASFSQESTRYCNYKGGVTFIIPRWFDEHIEDCEITHQDEIDMYHAGNHIWLTAMFWAERQYLTLLDSGWPPQQARSVLPNSLKTEIVITTNFREWRHIFKLRCALAAHPQMRELMTPLLKECKELIPVIFDDIKIEGIG